jgi:uncharacterized damage-inducible protein DinB
MRSWLHSHFQHLAWADARVIGQVSSVPSLQGHEEVRRLLAHVIAAERIWLLRVRGEDAAQTPIWPDWTLDRIQRYAADNAAAFAAFVADGAADQLDGLVEYRNSQGVAFRTPLGDILTHVTLHGSYHRGQIASAIRAAGTDPVNTDYITYARERAAGGQR